MTAIKSGSGGEALADIQAEGLAGTDLSGRDLPDAHLRSQDLSRA
jgi:hypothetical protein